MRNSCEYCYHKICYVILKPWDHSALLIATSPGSSPSQGSIMLGALALLHRADSLCVPRLYFAWNPTHDTLAKRRLFLDQ